MTKRAFFSMPAASLAVFLGVNALVYAVSRHTIPRQVAQSIDGAKALDCLALGNSLMQAGFDETAFDRSAAARGVAVKSLNAALGSSYPVEHLILLRRALRTHARVRDVFYGFFDFQLTTLPDTRQRDLIGNRAMLYYLEPAIVPGYYRWRLPEKLLFHAVRLFPAIEERGVIWEKVEYARRRLGSMGLPEERTNRFGRAADFAVLEQANTEIFARECEAQMARGQSLSKPVADMIRLSRERGSRVAMIEMPINCSHRDRYYATPEWRRFRAYLKTLIEKEGAQYVQASDWVSDERMFLDHLHLGPDGSELFSRRLASSF